MIDDPLPIRRPHSPRLQQMGWDAAIILVALCGVLLGLAGMRVQGIGGWILILIGWGGSLLTLYGALIEPRRISVNKKIIQNEALPPLVIAILSDLHLGAYLSQKTLKKAVARIAVLEPDFIFLPGDFLDNHRSSTAGLKLLRALPDIAPTYAVTGNHDAGCFHTFWRQRPYATVNRSDEVEKALTALGICVLRNAHRLHTVEGEEFAIAGIDDVLSGHGSGDLEQTLQDIPNDIPVLLLSHNPDIILQKSSKRCSIIVSGHTHGGQLRLPFIGPIVPIPDTLGRRFAQGVFPMGKTTLVISRGLGSSGMRARLFCPPEILLIRNKPTSAI